jgi:Rrf2 family protein
MSGLIRMSEGAALAIHACALLAQDDSRRQSASELAEALDASEHHLAKVLHRLVQAGLLESVRGPGGGVRLKRRADRLRLIEIYKAVDGAWPKSACLFDRPVCKGRGCVMGRALKEADALLKKHLSETTLADVAKTYKAGVPNA